MVHNGSGFVKATVKKHNGTGWDTISQQTLTKTWDSTWSQSYNGADSNEVVYRTAKWGDTISHYEMWYGVTESELVKWNNLKSPHRIYEGTRYIVTKKSFPRKRDSGWMYQGRRPPESVTSDRGRQRSMIGFNSSNIASELKGSDIVKVEMYLRNQSSWLKSGSKAVIGYHNSASTPDDFSATKHAVLGENFSVGQGKWVTLPKEFAELIRDGKAKGLTLFANNDTQEDFGVFYGHSTDSKPKIRITYRK